MSARRLQHYPRGSALSGWWSVTAKVFPTRRRAMFGNARVHESSQVLPEFLLHQLKEAP